MVYSGTTGMIQRHSVTHDHYIQKVNGPEQRLTERKMRSSMRKLAASRSHEASANSWNLISDQPLIQLMCTEFSFTSMSDCETDRWFTQDNQVPTSVASVIANEHRRFCKHYDDCRDPNISQQLTNFVQNHEPLHEDLRRTFGAS